MAGALTSEVSMENRSAKSNPATDNKTETNLGIVLFIGPDDELFDVIEDHLRHDFEFSSYRVSSGKAMISKSVRDAAQICFISAEALGNISDVVDYCMALRESKPDIPTILLSADVSMSDYSTERWEICDATVKVPTSRVSTTLAVSAAFENNIRFVFKCMQSGRWRDPDELLEKSSENISEQLEESFMLQQDSKELS